MLKTPPFQATSYEFCEYVPARNFIGGRWLEPSGAPSIPVMNPRHGQPMSKVPLSGEREVHAAVRAAGAAYPAWRATPIRERAQVMYRLKSFLERDLEELSWLVCHENGKTIEESRASVLKAIECVEFGCSLPNLAAGEILDVSRGVSCQTSYEPLGVCAGITPFNFPLMVPLWMIPQCIVGGNSFVLKASEQVPLSAMRLVELLREAEVPDGVVNLVHGGREAVEALSDHPEVKALAFVGSTKVAKAVYGRGTATGKRVLCLGGAKNHLLLLPDADPVLSAENIVASFTGCAGQRCMAASLLAAIGEVDPIIDAIVRHADKLEVGKDMGAIINEASYERIHRYIDEAEKNGAKVLLDGRGKKAPECNKGGGWWIGPTILDGVASDAPAACDEIFGPVLSIVRFDTVEAAIAKQNSSGYGNGAAVYTSSGHAARTITERLEAGMVGVNVGVPVPREPFGFGGWNDSKFGHGNITGLDGFRFWTRPRKLTTKWAEQSDRTWMS
jgi:malonate-semialdehyde dehydrogenase (acetylating) / methylmalonate-semialdehyde dehydrogenase